MSKDDIQTKKTIFLDNKKCEAKEKLNTAIIKCIVDCEVEVITEKEKIMKDLGKQKKN